MESIRIIPDLEVAGFRDEEYEVSEYTGPLIIGGLAEGTEEKKPVVMLALETDDGDFVVKQTTLSLFLTAADTFKAKYGDPRLT